jgi:hypothetical protein
MPQSPSCGGPKEGSRPGPHLLGMRLLGVSHRRLCSGPVRRLGGRTLGSVDRRPPTHRCGPAHHTPTCDGRVRIAQSGTPTTRRRPRSGGRTSGQLGHAAQSPCGSYARSPTISPLISVPSAAVPDTAITSSPDPAPPRNPCAPTGRPSSPTSSTSGSIPAGSISKSEPGSSLCPEIRTEPLLLCPHTSASFARTQDVEPSSDAPHPASATAVAITSRRRILAMS